MARVTSTSSSSSGSDSDTSTRKHLKRKFDADSDSSSESEASTDSEAESSIGTNQVTIAAKNSKKTKEPIGESGEGEDEDENEDVQVISHKDQRKLKKKQKLLSSQAASGSDSSHPTKPNSAKDDRPTRQNSIWVGNLSFKTTPDALRKFFADAGETTRVHMPTKALHGTKMKTEGASRGENRGFAYVDFATPEAKVIAVQMSEKNLDGRRLLIKDGDDFTGRPAATATDPTSSTSQTPISSVSNTGISKTAQKILARQKQPACPCLFLGNLGFEATDESVREMFERNARGRERWIQKDKKPGKGEKRKRNDTDLDGEDGEELQEKDDGGDEREKGTGIRKVRLGTFEDSGNCKGFGFVDFPTIEQATAALINPYNHSLDGRSLVVEYASADAARRGGYRPAASATAATEGGSEKQGRERKGRRVDADGRKAKENRFAKPDAVPDAYQARDSQANGDEEPEEGQTWKKRRTGEAGESLGRKFKGPGEGMANSKHRRAKPGAALALAQREKVAIVPSTGTKLTFT